MKTKTVKQLPYKLLAILLLLPLASCQEIRQVKVTVTEENNTPIEAANVSVDFLGYQGSDDHKVKGITNDQGILITNGAAELDIQARISKEGYYETYLPRLGRSKDHDLTCVLRKKINPIGLYARKLELSVPVLNEEVGIDLEVGDWVRPYGVGKVSDFVCIAHKTFTDFNNYETILDVSFLQENEGVRLIDKWDKYSSFKSPYTAFLDGYSTKVEFISKVSSESKPKGLGSTLNENYILRSRVKVDKAGTIVTAHYSKLIDAISVMKGSGRPNQNPIVKFTYYFNPTPNDRNLEFDPTKNLFQNLGTSEQVREP